MQNKRTPQECLKFMRDIAQQNSAELLDNEWDKWDSYYFFKLANGDIIKRKYIQISMGGWHKSKNFKTKSVSIIKSDSELLTELKIIAESNQGKLSDIEWKGSKYKYCFENELGQIFYRNAYDMKRKGWPKDWNNFFKPRNAKKTFTKDHYLLLNELHTIAAQNNGKCLATQWLGRDTPHLFEDEYGTQFLKSPASIRKGVWIGDRGLVAEPICRQVFEHLFSTAFSKTTKVLTAKLLSRKKSLELDGYSETLKIAFEYQGHSSHWDCSHKNYSVVQFRDNLKKEWCKKLGITLIHIPKLIEKEYIDSNYVFNFIKQLIIDKFSELNLQLPSLNLHVFNIQFNKINYDQKQFQILKDIAKKHNGTVITSKWLGISYEYTFKDSNNQIFKMKLRNYYANGWPNNLTNYMNHQAGHKKSKTELLTELHDLALSHNCKLLDSEWKGIKHKYSFIQQDNSIVKKTASSMKKFGLNTLLVTSYDKDECYFFLLSIAKENNANLIDKEWKNVSNFYSFNVNGTIYKFTYSSLKKKGWPKDLDKFQKHSQTIKKTPNDCYQELIDFANKHKGKVISPTWLGNHTLHEFITEDGMIFQKKPVNIKRSGWYK